MTYCRLVVEIKNEYGSFIHLCSPLFEPTNNLMMHDAIVELNKELKDSGYKNEDIVFLGRINLDL